MNHKHTIAILLVQQAPLQVVTAINVTIDQSAMSGGDVVTCVS